MKTLESAGWTALGNGYYKQTNFKSGAVVLKGGGVDHATLFCHGDPAVGKTYFR